MFSKIFYLTDLVVIIIYNFRDSAKIESKAHFLLVILLVIYSVKEIINDTDFN